MVKKSNEDLKEVGKALLSLANLILVLFLLNTYMQKDSFGIIGVILSFYGVGILYYYGYFFINKGADNA